MHGERGLGRYREVLGVAGAPATLAGACLLFVTSAAVGLAVLLAVRESGDSLFLAGLGAGALAFGAGVAAPLRGRLLDRHGAVAVVGGFGAVHAGGLFLLALVLSQGGPALLYLPLGAVTGAAFPPAFAAMNKLWGRIFAGRPAIDAAYALEEGVEQLSLLLGPLLVGLMVGLWSATAALLGLAIATLCGTVAFAMAASHHPEPASPPVRQSWLRALSSPDVRVLVIVSASFGAMAGAVEIGLARIASEQGDLAATGILLGALALGGMAGGVGFGALSGQQDPKHQLVVSMLLGAALTASLGLVDPLLAVGSLALLTGVALAPANVRLFYLVNRLAVSGMEGETYTWIASAQLVGLGVGNALGGWAGHLAGSHSAFLLGSAALLLGGTLAARLTMTASSNEIPDGVPSAP